MTLRPAAAGDESFLERLYASTRAEELAVVGWTAEQKVRFLAQQFAARQAHYRGHYGEASSQIVLVDGEPAGRLYVARRPDEIRIIDIALLPDYRGRGFGTELLRRLLAEAAGAGKAVRMHVERHNPAQRLYERLGFSALTDDGVYRLLEWRSRAVA